MILHSAHDLIFFLPKRVHFSEHVLAIIQIHGSQKSYSGEWIWWTMANQKKSGKLSGADFMHEVF